jgi:hypothetical protein
VTAGYRPEVLYIVKHFVKTEAHMGSCMKAIFTAIQNEPEVFEVFEDQECGGQKLSAYKMSELVKKLADYKFNVSSQFFEDGVHLAHEKLIQFESDRLKGNDAQRKKMQNYVVNAIGDDAVFRSLLLELYGISHAFEAKTSEYTHSQYQCYIAARCIQGCDPRYAFMLGSGQGKSIIALLMAAYYKTHGRKVTIVSASKQLKM